LEPWRVEVCEDCGGYIKTLDQRHGGHLAMPKVDLFLEDARTLTLNLLAEEEGYRRGGRKQ
ncbi:MAG TPA: formate dehydrogenase accessory protein FdhE, partial [Symbiobacteriaceae bacterium]|nr:formate dehydrogenase accessory protein FdhE [Symbiobacteriaceae bacterium]